MPFTDGKKLIQIVVNLKKSYETKGREFITGFEKGITLAIIDEAWKEHLREMDDLKQSVQNAVYEQKDPLLIYKFESFGLFKQMIERINREIITFLFRGSIPAQYTSQVQQAAPPRKTDMSRLKASKSEAGPGIPPANGAAPNRPPAPARVQPVRVEPKVGRNDPCPCGSGKKHKSCHGR